MFFLSKMANAYMPHTCARLMNSIWKNLSKTPTFLPLQHSSEWKSTETYVPQHVPACVPTVGSTSHKYSTVIAVMSFWVPDLLRQLVVSIFHWNHGVGPDSEPNGSSHFVLDIINHALACELCTVSFDAVQVVQPSQPPETNSTVAPKRERLMFAQEVNPILEQVHGPCEPLCPVTCETYLRITGIIH